MRSTVGIEILAGVSQVRRDLIEGNSFHIMTSDTSKNPQRRTADGSLAGSSGARGKEKNPDWANGLRQLYDSVVEEPLPDSFQDLLAKLDSKD